VFSVVKFAGALYLVYLGVRTLRSSPVEDRPIPGATLPAAHAFRDGFLVALLNPKTAIFFAAFLPQFLSPGAPPMLQSIVLGSLFVAIAVATDGIYAMIAASVRPALRRNRGGRLGRIAGGSIFVGLGLYTALSGSREVR
jgi:threonine/homoserine/homoserine lactone efflux protein